MVNMYYEDLKRQIEKEGGPEFTDDPHQAIFILNDGSLIGEPFDCGCRGLDHNCLLGFDGCASWPEAHRNFCIVRLVPETNTALILENQVLNEIQKAIIDSLHYAVKRY